MRSREKQQVSIIGGGASGLALAAFLDPLKFEVNIYEKNKALGRKLLVAGKGGFNLTHSEPVEELIDRYTPSSFLRASLLTFSNVDFRNWLASIGVPTYVGSSKRVYPTKGIKPIEVLHSIQKVLKEKNVKINYDKTWMGWNDQHQLLFNETETIQSDIVVFALGGGSWKVTGSDGSWLSSFEKKGIKTTKFQASNCAYGVDWKNDFISKYAGSPLKNIAISCEDTPNKWQKGEVVITTFGLEGNAIYALSPMIRNELNKAKKATIYIDFKPTLPIEELLEKLNNNSNKNISTFLKKEIKLSAAQIGLLKAIVSKENFLAPETLARSIKQLPLIISSSAKIDEAISTVGGISLSAVDPNFQIKALQNNQCTSFCIGEQLNWDAPTGGYLLQACFSMGVKLASDLNKQ